MNLCLGSFYNHRLSYVCFFVNNFPAIILHQSPNFTTFFAYVTDKNYQIFGCLDQTSLRHRSKFKNQNCSRSKLLCHTKSLSWPKLLSPRISTCYLFSIRYFSVAGSTELQLNEKRFNRHRVT